MIGHSLIECIMMSCYLQPTVNHVPVEHFKIYRCWYVTSVMVGGGMLPL